MNFVSPEQLAIEIEHVTVLDVRKPRARRLSGRLLAGSSYRHPFDAANWANAYQGHQLVIYCVHGHEVSQAVCGFLRDEGLDCRYVEGGLAGLTDAGFHTIELAEAEQTNA